MLVYEEVMFSEESDGDSSTVLGTSVLKDEISHMFYERLIVFP